MPGRGAAAHPRRRDARRADPRQDRRAATGARISATARRCSSTPRPGACCSPASWSRPAARRGLSAALTRLIARGGEPLIRKGVDLAMRMMGEQFVTGQTIDEALANGRAAGGARASAIPTTCWARRRSPRRDAAALPRRLRAGDPRHRPGRRRPRHLRGPGHLDQALGAASALQPRAARARAWPSCCPRLKALARAGARATTSASTSTPRRPTGWSSRSTCSSALCFEPELAGWNGIGFVVQAYQKRCPFVIDWLIDLARRSGRRLMVRLVKGAYWDSEIKRAQVDGLDGYPGLHAQGPHRRLLPRLRAQAAGRARRGLSRSSPPTTRRRSPRSTPWPATTSTPASTSSSACTAWASRSTRRSSGADKLDRPCRIYAPVGTHETLLAYLVRRLLENGANTSFVNRSPTRRPARRRWSPTRSSARGDARAARRAAPAHRPAARPVRRGADELARARPRQRAACWHRCAALLPARRRAGAPCRCWPTDRATAAPRDGAQSRRPARRRRHGDRGDAGARSMPRWRRAAAAPAGQRRRRRARRAACARAADLLEARLPTLLGPDRARGRQVAAPTRSPRCARRSTSCATTRAQVARLRQRHAPAARRRRLHQPVELPAGDLHRPGRAARWPPATRCSPSRPSRRR